MMFLRDELAELKIKDYSYVIGIDLNDLSDISDFFLFGGAIRDAFVNKSMCKDLDLMFAGDPGRCLRLFSDFSIASEDSDSMCGSQLSGRKLWKTDTNLGTRGFIDLMWPKELDSPIPICCMLNAISEVDIDISGIAYNPKCGFIECVPGVLDKIKHRVFSIRIKARGYLQGRSEQRAENLIKNGWLKT